MRTLPPRHIENGESLMSRGTRIALLVAAVLIVAVSGTVLATRQPQTADEPAQVTQDGDDTPPTAEELAHAESRLEEVLSSDVNPDVLSELATQYGLGGAVRIIAWSGNNSDEITKIRDMRDSGGPEGTEMGWGRIAKLRGEHPGIGSIMGNGGGNGRDSAPGQQDRGTDEGDASGG
jgi:hypothetical protein